MIKSETIVQDRYLFDSEFKTSFDSALKLCDSVLQELTKIDASKFDEYGICVNKYSYRYITPEDVSTYISSLVKLATAGYDIFNFTANEIDMFSVASIKKFVASNNGEPFESSTAKNRAYVNPRYTTIRDLMLLCQNDVHEKCVCSSMDLKQRLSDEKFVADVNTLKNMHFPAVMRNIMNGIPDIFKRSVHLDPMKASLLMLKVSEFLMFTVTLMTHTANEMLAYVTPIKSYKTVVTESTDVITECCLLKTNNITIRSKLPFDCNMRNVVLQDVHPYFADTRDALLFILKDTRSPFMQMVTKYRSNNATDIGCDVSWITNLTRNRHDRFDRPVGDVRNLSSFQTNLDWLHDITFGNAYLNGNYRRDANGNNYVSPILNTLNTIYKTFSCDDLKTNTELADNILRVANSMMSIIESYLMDQIENHDLVRDILCVMGECMTRSMIRLYDNNSNVLVYDVNMQDTESPGYSYMESFIMEADEDDGKTNDPNKQAKPVVSDPNAEKKDKSAFGNIKQKLSELIRKFTTWVREKLSQFPSKWTRDHAVEVKWVNGNKELNETIKKALDEKTFRCTIANMPHFKIPGKDIVNKAAKIGDIIEQYLEGEKKDVSLDDYNKICREIKLQVYPFAEQVLNAENEQAALTNVILFSNPVNTATSKDNIELQSGRWDDLIKDLTETGNLIQTEIKACQEGLNSALTKLTRASKETAGTDENGKPKLSPKAERADVLFKVVTEISQKYVTLLQNVISRKFYAVEYNMYRDIVKLYKQQTKENNGKTEPAPKDTTNNTNTDTNSNANNNQ